MPRKKKVPTPCHICGRLVKHLKNHMRVHDKLPSGSKTCPICSLSLQRTTSLQRHIAATHSETKFECFVCHKQFATAMYLKRHAKTHTKVQCSVCRHKYSEDALRHHMRKHNGTEIRCDLCPAKFTRKQHLVRHQRGVHETVGPFSCNSCQVEYARKAELTKHIRTMHSESFPVCNICQHRHAQRRPCTFKCGYCMEAFSNIDHLQLHQLVHCKFGRRIVPDQIALAVPDENSMDVNNDTSSSYKQSGSDASNVSMDTTNSNQEPASSVLNISVNVCDIQSYETSVEHDRSIGSIITLPSRLPSPTTTMEDTTKYSTHMIDHIELEATQNYSKTFEDDIIHQTKPITAFVPIFCSVCGQKVNFSKLAFVRDYRNSCKQFYRGMIVNGMI